MLVLTTLQCATILIYLERIYQNWPLVWEKLPPTLKIVCQILFIRDKWEFFFFFKISTYRGSLLARPRCITLSWQNLAILAIVSGKNWVRPWKLCAKSFPPKQLGIHFFFKISTYWGSLLARPCCITLFWQNLVILATVSGKNWARPWKLCAKSFLPRKLGIQ